MASPSTPPRSSQHLCEFYTGSKTNRARSSKYSGGGAAHPPLPCHSPPPTNPPPCDLPFPAAFRPPPAPISFSFSGASHPPAPSSTLPIPPLLFDQTSIAPRSSTRTSSDVALTVARHTIKGAAASRGGLSGPTATTSLEQGLERLGDSLPTMMSAILTIQDLAEGIKGGEGLAEAGVGARRNMDTIGKLYEATRKMVRKKKEAAATANEEQGDVDFSRDLKEKGDRGSS